MAQKGKLTTADYLTVDQFNQFATALHNDEQYTWELFCRMAFCCGLRASDVLQLRWGSILNKKELTIVEIKTGKIRKINMNKSVRNKIKDLYILMGSPGSHQPIIYNPKTRKRYTIQTVNEKLKQFRVKYRLNIKNFSTHTFRKTFGRMVYESSGRSAEALVLLNSIFKHSSIQTTKAYIGITQEEIQGVYNLVLF